MRLELCFNSIALAIVTVWTNDKHFALLFDKIKCRECRHNSKESVSTDTHYIYKYSNFVIFTKALLTLCIRILYCYFGDTVCVFFPAKLP